MNANKNPNPKRVVEFIGMVGKQLPKEVFAPELMQFCIQNGWMFQEFFKNLEQTIKFNALRLTSNQFLAFTSSRVARLAKPFREENLIYVKSKINEYPANDYFGICYLVFNDKEATWDLCLKTLDSLDWIARHRPEYEQIWRNFHRSP
jgi:hypothetical protein